MSPSLSTSTLLLVVAVALVATAAAASGAGPVNCGGQPNNNAILSGPLTFVRSVPNGKLYRNYAVSPPLSVLHVWGTPYEMGFAHGTLLQDEVKTLMPQVLEYIYSQIGQYIKFLPPILQQLIEEYGVAAALDATAILTEPWTPEYFIQEMRGLAAAVPSLSYSEIYQIMMFPELIKAQCSMYGAWGKATANTNGTLFQVRALDWTTNGPFQQFPLVLVYHPNDGAGHPFSIVGWAGFIGAISGFSSAPVAVCEKVWDGYNESSSRLGIPFHFLLRDILQFDVDIDEALMRIENAARTCSIFIGLGDSTNTFTALAYSYEEVLIWEEKNQPVYQNHPYIENVVYIDKHVQPSHDPCLASLLQTYYGRIDAVNSLRYITSQFKTGDMHIAIYDFHNSLMYVANASPMPNVVPAYSRPFVRLDMAQLFNETRP